MKTIYILAIGLCFALAYATPVAAPAMSDEIIRDAYQKSYHYEKAQNYEDAIKAITPIITTFPQGYTVNLRLGWLYYLAGNYANARSYYQAAMKIAPASLEAKLGYTLPLLAQERYDEAEAIAKEIIRIDVSNYYANLRLAFALRMQKKYEAAEEVLNRVLPLYPTDVKFLSELGLVKTAENQPEAARRIFSDVLTLDPEKRIGVTAALNHPYLDEGRLRYHSCMCGCCHTSASGMRQYALEFEPTAERAFDDDWERDLTCVSKVKEKMHRFILDQINSNRVPLCINPSSAAYKSFASSTVAHPSELPPSPHHWE